MEIDMRAGVGYSGVLGDCACLSMSNRFPHCVDECYEDLKTVKSNVSTTLCTEWGSLPILLTFSGTQVRPSNNLVHAQGPTVAHIPRQHA